MDRLQSQSALQHQMQQPTDPAEGTLQNKRYKCHLCFYSIDKKQRLEKCHLHSLNCQPTDPAEGTLQNKRTSATCALNFTTYIIQPAGTHTALEKTSRGALTELVGLHTRLNLKSEKSALLLYLLIDPLHREGLLVQVCEGQLRRYQRTTWKNLQGRLFEARRTFEDGEKTSKAKLSLLSSEVRDGYLRLNWLCNDEESVAFHVDSSSGPAAPIQQQV
ncbi:hypothetical protein Bbelb_397360 [Branchiostoma belcheri]|nr:hypothetical protein Bbelb_397360 [Branchiostoma belcheri]